MSHQDVSSGSVDEVVDWLTGVDQETVGELHGLGTGSTQLTGNDDLATLGAGLHDVSDDTVGGSSDGETVEKLESHGLGLRDSRQTTVLDTLGVQHDGAWRVVETFLDQERQLVDASAVLAEHVLSACSTDDDLGLGWRHTDLDTGVAFLGELSGEELIELGVEHTVGD